MGKYYLKLLIIVGILTSVFLTYLYFNSERVEIDYCETNIIFYNKKNNMITSFAEKITEEERRRIFNIINKKNIQE